MFLSATKPSVRKSKYFKVSATFNKTISIFLIIQKTYLRET